MNKMMFWAVCGAALFFGCSESPHTAGTTENENTIKAEMTAADTIHQKVVSPSSSFRLGECLGSALFKEAMPQAFFVQDSAGNDMLMVPRLSDYCEVEANIAYEFSGDTLTAYYDEIFMATDCVCYSDHWFDLPAEYKGAKYFRFYGDTYEIIDSKMEETL